MKLREVEASIKRFWLWFSSEFPLCRLWISNSLTASAGSGTSSSRAEPNRNWRRKRRRKRRIKNMSSL
ncbi:hypothetical protein EYF80_060762 [Liparis tanakae]|uniref:Uncharacterized protein n=1 Tax=Liparis tanakae TaxID=230148 RepID=A0A4Z2EKJ6_9TELE|nr:hypothetical protein EYF80_060762 [Liparis tanakae]